MYRALSHSEIVLQHWQKLENSLHKESNSVELDDFTLGIPEILCVSRYGHGTNIPQAVIKSLEAGRSTLTNRLENGDIIYGINTGFGGSADLRPTALKALQHTLTRELTYGVLPPGDRDHSPSSLPDEVSRNVFQIAREHTLESQYVPWTWVRAAILIRINSLIKSCSAVRPELVQRLQDILKHDIIPMVPIRGSISASGDLNPLAYISGVIQGKSTISVFGVNGKDSYADTAMRQAGLEPITLEPKEGLALVNGTAFSAAAGALALMEAHSLAVLAQILTAMSVEALNGTMESFHPFIAESRPHPGQIESARNIRAFLKHSKLVCENDGVNGALRQDRYATRTSPQWLGPALEDLVLADQQISIECNSATDNPLVSPSGDVLHGGNFQAKAVTSAMEKTRQAVQTLGRMLFAQCTEMINPATNRGLPPNLVGEDPTTTGIFKAIDIHIAALQAELGFLSGPVNHVQTAEMGNQSLNSLALISARYTHVAINVLAELAATHLLAVCQAADIRAMTIQFWESFHPQFSSTWSRLWRDLDRTPGHKTEQSLRETLLKAFETTTHLDDDHRFVAIAKFVRHSILDDQSIRPLSDHVFSSIDRFTQALGVLLQDKWIQHRNFYLEHGDATAVLGQASRQMYKFVRTDLKIPFLRTSKIATPNVEYPSSMDAMGEQGFEWSGQAPTVGSYTSVLYRALRDGSAISTLKKILSEACEEVN